MRSAFLVAFREYTENIRTRGFWISILVLPVILLLSVRVPVWLQKHGTPSQHFVLVDQSGEFAPLIEARLGKIQDGDAQERRHLFQKVDLPSEIDSTADLKTIATALKPYLQGKKQIELDGGYVGLDAAILIPKNIDALVVRPKGKASSSKASRNGIEFWSGNSAEGSRGFGSGLHSEIEQVVTLKFDAKNFLPTEWTWRSCGKWSKHTCQFPI